VPQAEVFAEFSNVLTDEQGISYHAHVCGGPMDDGKWQGWIEFLPLDGSEPIRSGRETTQPNRAALEYWATGLTAVYLEGALERALNPLVVRRVEPEVPVFDGPAPPLETVVTRTVHRDAVLDPFSVYEHGGEILLRRQLAALSSWHLVGIIEAYQLSDQPESVLAELTAPVLIEVIVTAVQADNVTVRELDDQ
jgi:hypothetical protein